MSKYFALFVVVSFFKLSIEKIQCKQISFCCSSEILIEWKLCLKFFSMENSAYAKRIARRINCIKTLLAEKKTKQNVAYTADLGCVPILFPMY